MAVIIMVLGPLLALALVYFYAIPYDQAMQTAGEKSNTALIFSLGMGMSVLVSGALAWWGTRRSYSSGS